MKSTKSYWGGLVFNMQEIAGKLFDIDRSDMTTAEEQIAQILVENDFACWNEDGCLRKP